MPILSVDLQDVRPGQTHNSHLAAEVTRRGRTRDDR